MTVFKSTLCFLLFGCLSLKAQFIQDTSKNVRFLVVPILFKNPEVGFGAGISSSISFKTSNRYDTLTRTSVIQGAGFYTTRHQNVQAIDATIYFPKERYIFLFRSTHTYFPDKFWGIGPKTNDKIWERYIYEHIYFNPHVKMQVAKHFFCGLLAEFQNVFRIIYPDSGLFFASNFYGKHKYKVLGFGGSFGYDTRNNAFYPTKGVFLNTQITSFQKGFVSDYTFLKWQTDFRYFQKIAKGHILAFQLYNYKTFGQTPLRDLASMGGQDNLRGFYLGRYRANNMITFITEYRVHLYNRWSACLFGGLGNVYNRSTELVSKNTKYSYGGGLRFAVLEKEKLHIRVDYGYYNKYNSGLYLTVGECF